MSETGFGFLSERSTLSISLPDELDPNPILSLPILDGTVYTSLLYASAQRVAQYGLPSGHPVYLEAVVRGIPVTVMDLADGADEPNRGRFLILWTLPHGSAWLTLESGAFAEQQVQAVLGDIYVYEDDAGAPRVNLLGNAQTLPPEHPLGAEVASFIGPDSGPVQGANIYRLPGSSLPQTRLLGLQSQLSRVGTGSRGLTVEAVVASDSGVSVEAIATAIGTSIQGP